MTTTGAPHSSTEASASSTEIRLSRIGVGIIDLATTRASQIAPEQRLQHQDERVALAASEMLPDDVGADSSNLPEGYAQLKIPYEATLMKFDRSQLMSSAGRRKLTVSAGPSRVDTSDGAIRIKVRTTSSTTISGADAPAVTPTTAALRTHSGSISPLSATR